MTDPERIDALLAGAPPRDDDERALQALAERLRAQAAPAPDALRARVRRITHDAAPPPPRSGRAASRWRRIGALAAPVAVAAVAAALVVPGLRDGSPADPPAAPALRAPVDSGGRVAPDLDAAPSIAAPEAAAMAEAAPPAPAPAVVVVADPAALRAVTVRAEAVLRGLGATTVTIERRPRRALVTADVPPARRDEARRRIAALGTAVRPPDRGPAATASAFAVLIVVR